MFPSRARLYLTEKHVSVDLMGSRHQRSSPTSGSRWAMPKAPSSGRALPILMRKFFRLEPRPGKAPALDDVDPQGGDIGALFDRYPGQFATSRVVWQSPASSKAALLWTGKEWIAPGTNKSTPMSEGGPLRYILLLSFGRKTKKATRGPRRPRMASMPPLSIGHTGLPCTTNVASRHSGVIGCVRTFPPCKRKHIKRLCLNAARLVNAMPAPFLCTEQHK